MNIKEVLQERLENEDNRLVKYVIEDILNQDESYMESYMRDVQTHGCVSGMVGGLIYHSDTHKFYDDHYDEIEDFRLELLEQGINVFDFIGDKDFKNQMAWIAYEETMRLIYDELEDYV